ncbi:hypothetical protein [Leeia sp.]|uniref:hypothetical protein n=1 Tax=Leeia sp. TaxID=2884678 RepID=UPI0035B065AE
MGRYVRRALAGLLALPLWAMATGPTWLGVLEEQEGTYDGEPAQSVVRVLFQRTEAGWQALPSDCRTEACLRSAPQTFPARLNWTVWSRGWSVGTVEGVTPAAFTTYSRLGQQQLAGPAPWPADAPKAQVSVHMPAQRLPLLATVGGVQSASSPQGWQAQPPDQHAKAAWFPYFRQHIPRVKACTRMGRVLPVRPVRQDDLQVISQWQDQRGNQLAQLQFKRSRRSHCDGDLTYPEQLWFYRPRHGKVQLLPDQLEGDGFGGPSLTVLSVVDLDGNGQPGFLMMREGYNRYGYALYQPGQRAMPQFLVSFH